MDPEHRDKLREAARRQHNNCPRCGAFCPTPVDASVVGGVPGIMYRFCNGCGWTKAITKKQRKFTL